MTDTSPPAPSPRPRSGAGSAWTGSDRRRRAGTLPWQRPRQSARAFVGLCLLCAGLAAVVAAELAWPPGSGSASGPDGPGTEGGTGVPGAGPPLPPPPSLALPPVATFAAVGERPLFLASRQRPAAAVTAPQPEEALDLVLVGVVITPTSRAAMVRWGTDHTVRRIAEGEEVAGWRIERIDRRHIVARSGRRTTTVPLWNDQ